MLGTLQTRTLMNGRIRVHTVPLCNDELTPLLTLWRNNGHNRFQFNRSAWARQRFDFTLLFSGCFINGSYSDRYKGTVSPQNPTAVWLCQVDRARKCWRALHKWTWNIYIAAGRWKIAPRARRTLTFSMERPCIHRFNLYTLCAALAEKKKKKRKFTSLPFVRLSRAGDTTAKTIWYSEEITVREPSH